jgi:hypothetical protein
MTYPENEVDLETPEVDAAEQATIADPSQVDDDAEQQPAAPVSLDASDWDAQEQQRVVPLEDEYR